MTELWQYACECYDARWFTPGEMEHRRQWDRISRTWQQPPRLYWDPLRYVACLLLTVGFIRAPEGTTFGGYEWRWRFWAPLEDSSGSGFEMTLRQRLPWIWSAIRGLE